MNLPMPHTLLQLPTKLKIDSPISIAVIGLLAIGFFQEKPLYIKTSLKSKRSQKQFFGTGIKAKF